jgi:ATP-dependent Zn protease
MLKAKARALEIVTGRRKDIQKIAAALLEHKRLDSQLVDLILTDSPLLKVAIARLAA